MKGGKRKKDSCAEVVNLDPIPEAALDQAKVILDAEKEKLLIEKINGAKEKNKHVSEHNMLHPLALSASCYDQERGCFVDNGDEVESLKSEFQAIREATMSLRKKNDKISTKLGVKNGGYAKRAKTLQENILQNFAQTQNHKIERSVFESLSFMEVRGANQRVDALREELSALEAEESSFQKKYGDLLLEKKRLLASMRSH